MARKALDAVTDEVVIKQLAAASVMGATMAQMMEQTGLNKYQINKTTSTPEFKKYLKEVGDEALSQAKQIIKSNTSKLATEITRVLTEELQNNSLEAVKIAIKIIGFGEEENKQQQDTQIIVNLPGSTEKVINTSSVPIEEKDIIND